jgi:hypothetical protein
MYCTFWEGFQNPCSKNAKNRDENLLGYAQTIYQEKEIRRGAEIAKHPAVASKWEG